MSKAATRRREFMFEAGDHLLATDVISVREVLEPIGATPIPGAVHGVIGLINIRGDLIVAVDLSRLVGIPSSGSTERALVVFERGGRRVAMEVDRVIGLVETGHELDIDAELLDALAARDLAEGVGQAGGRPYFRLDLEALFARVLGVGERSTGGPSTGGRSRK